MNDAGRATGFRTARRKTVVPWADVLLSAIAAVSWSLVGMTGVAALGLHLLEADSAGSLGPMTAAAVALGAGGSVTPSGDVSAFGLDGADVGTAIEITPLGVSLVGALLLAWFFLRSLRAAGVVVAPAELLARAGAVVALFVASLGGLAWAGHDVVTIDGGSLGLDRVPGSGISIPGIGDLGDAGGLLPDRLGDLVDAKAAVGFTVDIAPTLLGGLGWSAGVLLIALLASRRTPLPPGWQGLHRVVRPAVSAVVTVTVVAVAAGLAAAGYAAIGDDHPKRIAGAALLGAPNGVWLGIPLGLFVPWDGRATGALATLLPDPLDRLLSTRTGEPVTLGRLADLDGRVWLLAVAAASAMLLAGVLTAVRTPTGAGTPGAGVRTPTGAGTPGAGVRTPTAAGTPEAGVRTPTAEGTPGAPTAAGAGVRAPGAGAFAGRCAVRLGVVTALTLPLLVWLTGVSVNASLSVLGFDAFGAGIELHGRLGMALLLGAAWGAGAGAAGALLAWACGSAGWRAAPLATLGAGGVGAAGGAGSAAVPPGRRPGSGTEKDGWERHAGSGGDGHPADGRGQDAGDGRERRGTGRGGSEGYGAGGDAGPTGPYVPGAPYRPPNPDTNPYLRIPGELRDPEPYGARDAGDGGGHPSPSGKPPAPGTYTARDAAEGPAGTPGAGPAGHLGRGPRALPSGGPAERAHGGARGTGAPGDGARGEPPPPPPPSGGAAPDDVFGAPTRPRPSDGPSRPPAGRRGRRPRSGRGFPGGADGTVPPPPPPPPVPPPEPPGGPKGPRR